MSDVTMADCYVIGGNLQPPRPLTEADMDSLIRERGVTDEMVERAAEVVYDEAIAWLPDDNRWKYSTNETAKARARKIARAALEAALMTEEEE